MILGFTLAGEALQRLLPLPIPASVWGIALLLTALCLKIVKVEQVKDTASFLSSLLPLLFVSPAVKIVEDWALIREDLLGIVLVLVSTTVLAFAVGGRVAQAVLKRGGKNDV